MNSTAADEQEVFDARADALAAVLGGDFDDLFHAPHPFSLGGHADVLAFYNRPGAGAIYVTAELTGRPEASYADYELMICHRAQDDWGPNVISRLAPYVLEAYIDSGETMDIDQATPSDSEIKAFASADFADFADYSN